MNFMEIDLNNFKIPDLKEAYDNLRTSLGEDTFKQYKAVLKRYFSAVINKIKFDEEARKLLCSPEQIHMHNLFLLALTSKIESSSAHRAAAKRLDPSDYLTCSSPVDMHWDTMANNIKYFNNEMCLPDLDLIKGRIYLTSIDYGLEGADDDVSQIILIAMQMFVKNIITAMASRVCGYKVRENNFQYDIGQPVPNPWLRNTSNILDSKRESKVDIDDDDQAFKPKVSDTLEIAEQRMAHAYACSNTQMASVTRLTLRVLYETLLFNKDAVNCHSIRSIGLERILSQLDCS